MHTGFVTVFVCLLEKNKGWKDYDQKSSISFKNLIAKNNEGI